MSAAVVELDDVVPGLPTWPGTGTVRGTKSASGYWVWRNWQRSPWVAADIQPVTDGVPLMFTKV